MSSGAVGQWGSGGEVSSGAERRGRRGAVGQRGGGGGEQWGREEGEEVSSGTERRGRR